MSSSYSDDLRRLPLRTDDDYDLAWQAQWLLVGLAVVQPGIGVGALLASAWLRLRRPPRWPGALLVVVASGLALRLVPLVVAAWPLRAALGALAPGAPATWRLAPGSALPASFAVEALAAPAWLALFSWARRVARRSPRGILAQQIAERERRERFAARRHPHRTGPDEGDDGDGQGAGGAAVPDTAIRLGVLDNNGTPYHLPQDAYARHIVTVGKTGSGKTTTIAVVSEQWLARLRRPLVYLDAKGDPHQVGVFLRRTAQAAGLPYAALDPFDPATLRWNPCGGDPVGVANLLADSFDFGENAGVFRDTAQPQLATLLRALHGRDGGATLASLHEAMEVGAIRRLAVAAARAGDLRLQADLALLVDQATGRDVARSALDTMRARLWTLLQSRYAALFEPGGEQLDLAAAFEQAGATYIAVPAMDAPHDAQMLVRMLALAVGQYAAERYRRNVRGLPMGLLVFDEYAAMRQGRAVTSLLTQLRGAGIPCLLGTQFPPKGQTKDDEEHRDAVYGVGCIVVHALGEPDIPTVAAAFGTRSAPGMTHQLEDGGFTGMGSLRDTEEYVVHPNELRRQPVGYAHVLTPQHEPRYAYVRVDDPLSRLR